MKTKTFSIRGFSGIETKISGPDQNRGALRVADGANIFPTGALTFGPNWQTAWGQSALATAIATALSGATASKVHFVTVTRSGYTFLIAWEITAARPRGIWHVAGTGDPSLSSTSGSVVSAPNNGNYRDKTNSLPWYGTWIAGELWLGNGTDANLVWPGRALAVLGPQTTPTNPMDPSQAAFPPCKCWVRDRVGATFGGGNVTYPLRLWASEEPNINFPTVQGLKTASYSFKDLQCQGTAITALSMVFGSMIVHVDYGPPIILQNLDRSSGGWKFDQVPTEANAGAPNPNCVMDTKLAPHFLGSDLELYEIQTYRGSIVHREYLQGQPRDPDLVTAKASGLWNVDATKPISGSDYFLIFDAKGGRHWVWVQMSAGSRQGVYCYDERGKGVTGPWRYPDFLSACQLRDENLNGCLVVGITRDGVLLWSDVFNIGELTPPAYGTALAAAYLPVLTPPTSDPGIPYIGVDTVNLGFVQVLNSQTLYLADPWSQWSASGSVVPTVYFKNARLAVIEFAETDFGSGEFQKEIYNLRALWERNPYAYVIGCVEVNGARYQQYFGTAYPLQSWVMSVRGLGATARIRLLVISFNDQSAVLNSIGLDYMPSVEA